MVLAAVILQGCAMVTAGRHRLSSLSKIQVDNDQKTVEIFMGRPDVVRIGKRIADDKVYELHEYRLYSDACVYALSGLLIVPAYPLCSSETFWLHFVNSKLVFWGEVGDWRGIPKWFGSTYPGSTTAEPNAGQSPPKEPVIK
jgi:hypothetical protein